MQTEGENIGLSDLPSEILALISNELDQYHFSVFVVQFHIKLFHEHFSPPQHYLASHRHVVVLPTSGAIDFCRFTRVNKQFNTILWIKRTAFAIRWAPSPSARLRYQESLLAAQQAKKLTTITKIVTDKFVENAVPILKRFNNLTEIHLTYFYYPVIEESDYIEAFQQFSSLRALSLFHESEGESPIRLRANFFSRLPVTLEELCVTLTPGDIGPLHHLTRLKRLLLAGTRSVERLFACPRSHFIYALPKDIEISEWRDCMQELDLYLPRHISAKAIFGVTNMYLNMGIDIVYLSLAHIALRDKSIPLEAFEDIWERLQSSGRLDDLVDAQGWMIPLGLEYSMTIPSPIEYVYSERTFKSDYNPSPDLRLQTFDSPRMRKVVELVKEAERRQTYAEMFN